MCGIYIPVVELELLLLDSSPPLELLELLLDASPELLLEASPELLPLLESEPLELLPLLVPSSGSRQKPCASQLASASQQLVSSAHQNAPASVGTQASRHT